MSQPALVFACRIAVIALTSVLMTPSASAQSITNSKVSAPDAFRQLDEVLPTPNVYRTASGAPGPKYWQQEVDYKIDVTLDDDHQSISGSEQITYSNKSPNTLKYLWLQLDANRFHPQSHANLHRKAPSLNGRITFKSLEGILLAEKFPGGVQLRGVTNLSDETELPHTVVGSSMRIDLPKPLPPGKQFRFGISWNYNIPDVTLLRGRGGYEHFEKDGNNIYEIAQWFPRLCAYSDASGWQHKEFLGAGEFALEFGDYEVSITAPADHIVAATGVLQNTNEVLTKQQRSRLKKARNANEPVFVVSPEEARENERDKSSASKTWEFKAENVRDFAFASSRKFIWDAVGHTAGDKTVMAMSYYPNEAEPLWSQYSTHAIVHTLDVYSKYTFAFPYPTAISVNGPVYGMEYPMICFNGPRPEEDGTYSKSTKYALISVIIHEVGHNYFPMIVNSDERQWTWMDEGLNTFLQYLTEVEWEDKYPSRRGEPKLISGYMKGSNQVPIMTNSESLLQFGANGYSKPATALNVLRETVLGRALFDFAFKEYAQRWMFKRPYPADFFRTMEDASGRDLDWFWRGWFYTTDHVDIAITGLREYTINRGDPDEESDRKRAERASDPETLSQQHNKPLPKRVDKYESLNDFYNAYDDLAVTEEQTKQFEKFLEGLSPKQLRLLGLKTRFYIVDLENIGGLVMPVILKATHADGTSQDIRLPAEIWVKNARHVSRLIISQQEITALELDPNLETADVDASNNEFPPTISKSRFKLYKSSTQKNEMQKAGLGKKAKAEDSDTNDDDSPSKTKRKKKSD